MAVFQDLRNRASQVGGKITETTKTSIQQTQLNARVKKLQDQIDDSFRLMGAEMYDYLENEQEQEPDFTAACAEIREAFAEQLAIKKQLAVLKGNRIKCMKCEAMVSPDSIICPYCGTKL